MEENVPSRTVAEYVDSGRAGFRSDRHISPLRENPVLNDVQLFTITQWTLKIRYVISHDTAKQGLFLE